MPSRPRATSTSPPGAPTARRAPWCRCGSAGTARTFTTSPTSHKARRIAKGSPLLVWVGSKDGPHFEARAELVRDPELAARMGEAYRRKYWVAWLGFFCPSAERLRAGKIVIVRIRPPA